MRPVRSVGARLSLALLLVVAIALALVYVVVVPSLENRLIDSKLSQLEAAAPRLTKAYLRDPNDPDFPSNAAASANAQVVLLFKLDASSVYPGPTSLPGQNSTPFANDRAALALARTGEPQRMTVTRGGEQFAEVAWPVPDAPYDILLLSAPLHDTLANVHSVQRRMLIAGLVALLVAVAMGYGGASYFARRIRRLERAADRIAGGKFDEPIADPARDELGELARGFERMRERLAQLDHARREFVANASHELRTPLFSLGGFLELLADEDLDEPTRREFVSTMREQVERLTKLAEDLLDLTRLDAGRLHVESRPVDLATLADALVAEFRPVAAAAQHPLVVAGDGAVIALADEQRVLQIGRILVENALNHTPPGTLVAVSAAERDARAVLAVANDGPTIAPEHLEHLFDRFYRVDGARASGSGLGLAIAKELVELMGGTIGVETRDGRTEFVVCFNVKTPETGQRRGRRRPKVPVG